VKRASAVVLLGAASTLWAALPFAGAGPLDGVLTVVALAAVLAGAACLFAPSAIASEPTPFLAGHRALLDTGVARFQRAGWGSVAAVATVALEALHHSRPLHTGLLVVLVMTYLWALQAAGSRAPASEVRADAKVLALSLPLVALTTGVATLPAAGAGSTSGWLSVIASLAAIAAGALMLPL
jgi:hypothetical protein